MEQMPIKSTGEVRRRFCDLARILEKHAVTWTYDLLIDLDLYMTCPIRVRQDDSIQ